jgi:hypothetical protein
MRELPPRMQDQLYHDMILHDETLNIRGKARDFATRVVAPRASEIAHTEETRNSFPEDVGWGQPLTYDKMSYVKGCPLPADIEVST